MVTDPIKFWTPVERVVALAHNLQLAELHLVQLARQADAFIPILSQVQAIRVAVENARQAGQLH
jgi:hypothetical protein